MGAFKDLFKSKHETKQTKSSAQLPLPLWALATEPTARSSRPTGPRSPSKRSDVSSMHSTNSREDAEARARALAGRQAGERAREGLLHKRRRRSESLRELSQALDKVELGSSAQLGGRKPLPSPPGHARPIGHGRTYSTPAAILTRQDMHGGSPVRPRPLHSQSHQPTSPPKGRPMSYLSTSPTRPSLYPQALPAPPRPPLPPTVRGPNLFRQAAPSAPPSAPQSRNVSGASSCLSPMFPGSFPKDAGVVIGMRMTEPLGPSDRAASPGAQGGPALPYMSHRTDEPPPVYPYQYNAQPLHRSSHHHNSAPPPPPIQPRPLPRPMSSSSSAPFLDSYCKTPTEPGRKAIATIDLTGECGQAPATPARTPPSVKSQCHGTTGAGKRCTRFVAGGTPGSSPSKGLKSSALDQLEGLLREDDDGDGVIRLCFQHAKQAMGERGCFVTPRSGRGKWIEFDDWILDDLPVQTKLLLRHEMATPVSAKDEDGYLYVHEMVEKTPSHHPSSSSTYIKLGRSVHPVHRLSQWRSQCPSRQPIVRAIFPFPFPSATSASFSVGGIGMSGALRVAQQGSPNHHRWERLVLIEVAGRAEIELGSRGDGGRKTCTDCGRRHLELFEVPEGAFDDWVVEVVERWGRWVTDVLG